MRKLFISLSLISFVLLGSCSSDDNSGIVRDPGKVDVPGTPDGNSNNEENPDTDQEEEEANLIIGKWFPSNIKVSAMASDLVDLPYPHKDTCDKDFLVFEKSMDAAFTYHDDVCDVQTQGQKWTQDKDMLKFNLLGSDIEVKIIENTDKVLVVSGNGKQFENLIDLFLPDANIPPILLATTTLELSFNK